MITHLALRNWKAYNALALDLQDGATFVIARNGIGKTSLVQGAMWALFGDSSGIDVASCVRSGSQETSAEVSLALGKELALISRAYSADTGKTETAITVRGQTTAGTKAVERYLSEGLGAEPSILARMSFLKEGEAVAAETSAAEDLRSHLSRVFGVDTLVSLSRAEDQRRRRLTREAQETRRIQRLAATARAELTARLEELEANLVELGTELGAARTALAQEQEALASLTSWREFDDARQRWVAERHASLEDASERGCGLSARRKHPANAIRVLEPFARPADRAPRERRSIGTRAGSHPDIEVLALTSSICPRGRTASPGPAHLSCVQNRPARLSLEGRPSGSIRSR